MGNAWFLLVQKLGQIAYARIRDGDAGVLFGFNPVGFHLLLELHLQHCGIRTHVLRCDPNQGKVSVISVCQVRFPFVQTKWVSAQPDGLQDSEPN